MILRCTVVFHMIRKNNDGDIKHVQYMIIEIENLSL